MADIVRLRIAGFKSFVEPVELDILPGLTGVVGPNGCGKSNVVEALRWGMGESSAKQLRGGGMDDVIFAGASGRPARNLAEVSIGLIDPDGAFPSPWMGQAELEIVRRIQRGSGSGYRVNGREARARDVQTLFADLASGARSAAIVSQGQIGAFIVAKPEQRRGILEEAAGVAGLRARRHEATLRLNAAETNLERLEDVLLGFDNQLAGLEKQARQAKRYRNLSGLIQAAEAQAFIARWRVVEAESALAAAGAHAAEQRVMEAVGASAAAERHATEAAARLPALRRQDGEAAARSQRVRIQLERIEAERRRRADAKQSAAKRLEEIGRDRAREAQRLEDARAMLARLTGESGALEAAAGDLVDPSALDARLDGLAKEAASLRGAAEVAAEAAAESEAQSRAAARTLADARARAQKTAQAAESATAAHATAVAAAPDAGEVARLADGAMATRAAHETSRMAAETARGVADAARATADSAREARAEVSKAEASLAAERKTLASLVATDAKAGGAPVLNEIRADDGFETALGAALGDDLEASLDATASAFWSGAAPTAPAPALPAGARPLADMVRAPAALQARLAQIGVVEDWDAGERASRNLIIGQRLVTPGGDVWRWDGFRRKAGAETQAARKLAMRNRLEAVETTLRDAEAATATANAAAEAAQAQAKAAADAEKAARDRQGETRRQAERQAIAAAEVERALSAHQAGIAAKAEAAEASRRLAEEAQTACQAAEAAAAAAPDSSEARTAAQTARAAAATAEQARAEAQAERQRLAADQAENARRRAALADDIARQRRQADAAEATMQGLAQRAAEAEAARTEADAGDAKEDSDRASLSDALQVADAERRTLGDALAAAERTAAECAAAAKTAESGAGAAREARVAAKAAVDRARANADALEERILERLDTGPSGLGRIAGVEAETVTDDLDLLDRRVERLRRERENMGAVNLRAEAEIEEITGGAESIRRERDDLIAAVGKLRRAVADLAGEARQRLRATFEKIDQAFSEIFQTLFGGGRARLALVGSDDPLEAGLEIMASPPGKSLQTLSLLSGGERALTALALVFAAFRINPSPICVLDEIDAPLDDANVDRVCTLLEEMSASGRTRFLVITHHRMTMARMQRLYGVTMPERGVSQLVSVDFEAAQAIREAV